MNTCKVVRRTSAAVAGLMWVAATAMTVESPDDANTNVVLLMVSLAAAAAAVAAMGELLARGSAEKVYDLAHEAGYAKGRQDAEAEFYGLLGGEGRGSVTYLPTAKV